tara:strand:+ start:219 stop:542 length:324 start_codon:yes stop_codon:yes gene_type:complete
MTLSKKNIDKLKSIPNNNLSAKNNKSEYVSEELNLDNPNDIFYSLIDNSNDLNETTLPYKKLKDSEKYSSNSNNSKYNLNDINNNTSLKLTEEDLLYDEFNYLLDDE